MKNLLFTIAGLIILAITTSKVHAQDNPTASASATASAHIIVPIAITKDEGMDLKFGNIIANANGGTVAISTEGTATLSGINAPSIAGDRQQAQFTVTGLAGVSYAVTLPTSTTLNSGGNNMTVNSFVSNPNGAGVLEGGSQTLKVGATLNVGAAQASGMYTGNFSVTVAYN